jgi:hypothetical protein
MPRWQARFWPSTPLECRNLHMTSAHVMREPLRTLLGDYPTTRAVRQGTLISPRVPLAFAERAVTGRTGMVPAR